MRVNEIFYSLQGEGYFTGTPAVFIRLSGCNLACDFCDTEHSGFSDMTDTEIMAAISHFPTRHVVVTGGEPLLQLTHSLVDKLHDAGKFVQIETNGTIPLQGLQVDWVTCSPKFEFCRHAVLRVDRIDELKVIFRNQNLRRYENIVAKVKFVQPCDTMDTTINARYISGAIAYVKANPQWRLSLQTHKMLNIQ